MPIEEYQPPAVEKFDFTSIPKPIDVQQLEVLKDIRSLLRDLVQVQTPQTVIAQSSTEPVVAPKKSKARF